MSFHSEKKQLAESFRRALNAMQGWSAARRLQYQVTLGVKNRQSEFTRDFGGAAMPEADSVAALLVPGSASPPLIKLLYVLRHGDDLCLNAPTARSLTGQPTIADLIRIVKDAETAQLVRRTGQPPKELTEAHRDSIIGLTLTEEGKRYLDDVLHEGTTGGAPEPRAAVAQGT